jgi:hypothetical protein
MAWKPGVLERRFADGHRTVGASEADQLEHLTSRIHEGVQIAGPDHHTITRAGNFSLAAATTHDRLVALVLVELRVGLSASLIEHAYASFGRHALSRIVRTS